MLKYLFFISALFLFTSQLKANQPPCEVWNYDTESCETYAEQNLTINTEFAKLVQQSKTWTEEEVQAYLNSDI